MENKKKFTPQIGMHPKTWIGNGFKGTIEYVGEDYFILRSAKTNEPILIKPFQYHNFDEYIIENITVNEYEFTADGEQF